MYVTCSFLSLLSPADKQPRNEGLFINLHWTKFRSQPYNYPRYFPNDESATDYKQGGLEHPELENTIIRPSARCGHRLDPDGTVYDNKTRR